MKVQYNYLHRQFAKDSDLVKRIMARIEAVAIRGDFTLGKEVKQAEEKWCEITGAKYAVGVSNGTDAIALALIAVGVRPGTTGHAVFTVPNTFIGTAGAVEQVGAELRYVDVDDRTMNFGSYEKVYDAALPVAWCGLPPEPPPLALKSWTVLDGAQCVGSKRFGAPLTVFFDAVTYSLHPLKNINVWGDGGFVTTDDEGLADEVESLRNHGLEDRDTVVRYGFNHRLATLQAAVLLEVAEGCPFMWRRRHEIAGQYMEALNRSGWLVPAQPFDENHAYHVFQIRTTEREKAQAHFDKMGVEAKVHYPVPLHLQPVSTGRPDNHPGAYPVVEQQAKEVMSLPMNEWLTDEEVEHVCQTIRSFSG